MRLVGLSTKSFWVDELNALSVSQTFERIMSECRGGHTPPLRYFIVWALQQLPSPEFSVRLPAVIFGTLTIALMLWIGELVRDRRTGVLAAVLLLLSPWHLDNSQDARYYAMILFLALAGVGLAIRIIERPQPLWRWAALSVICVLNLYISYVAIFPVVAIIGYPAWSAWRSWRLPEKREQATILLRGAALAALVGFLVLSPWLSEMAGLFGRYVSDGSNVASVSNLPANAASSPSRHPMAWRTPLDWAYADDFLAKLGLQQPALKWALLAFFGIGLVDLSRRNRSMVVLAALWFIFPWAVILATGMRYFCPPRYLIHYLGLYLLLAAVGILAVWERLGSVTLSSSASVLSTRARRSAFYSLTAAIALAAFLTYVREDVRYFKTPKQDWRLVVRFLDENTAPSDAVLAGGYWTPLGLLYYGSELSQPINLIPRCTTARRIQRELALSPRAWYVTWGPLPGDVAALLARRFELVREFPGMHGTIQVYRSKPKVGTPSVSEDKG